MPGSYSITTFFEFAANSKAKASQVENNFDIFRGHLLPVSTTTATAANLTYDLGSTEYRWRNLYVNEIDFNSSTIAASVVMKGDATSTIGAVTVEIEDQDVYRFGEQTFTANLQTTTGEYLWKMEGTTVAKLNSNGFSYDSFFSKVGFTTTASIGQPARSAQFSVSYDTATASTINVAGSTCTVTTNGGPVLLMITNNTSTGLHIQSGSTAPLTSSCRLQFRRGGSDVCKYPYQYSVALKGVPGSVNEYKFSGNVWFLDFPAAGTYNYSLAIYHPGYASGSIIINMNGRVHATELF